MDATYFLKERTKFIRFYYDVSEKPFREMKDQIEAGAPPFEPPYSEDNDEPAFLAEWLDAGVAISTLGLSCVSMLSDALKLYFQTLQSQVIGFKFDAGGAGILKRLGFVSAYREALGEIFETDWTDCPVRFDVIEQVVLARNRGQHGADLTSLHVQHDAKTLEKHPKPFFASETEWSTWREGGGDPDAFFSPALEVTRDRLLAAIQEVEVLADWLDARMEKVWDWRTRARAAALPSK